MREIKIGDKTIGLKATPLALLFYKQEFGHDLVGDLIKIKDMQENPEQFDALLFLQLTWAMAKAANGLNKQFPSFTAWLSELETFDVTDMEVIQIIADEAIDGFFRTANKPPGQEA
jgi:hypothetical protein